MNTLKEYQSLAIRTMKDDPPLMRVLHCVMGMVGEAGELLDLEIEYSDSDGTPEAEKKYLENYMGELGDCLWYAANLHHELGCEMPEEAIGYGFDIGPTDMLLSAACALIDVVKKSVFYGKPLPMDTMKTLLSKYMDAWFVECDVSGGGVLFIAEANIKKLEKRYPDLRFNAEHAINRDYEAESKAAGINIV